jgi:hypothetical protein
MFADAVSQEHVICRLPAICCRKEPLLDEKARLLQEGDVPPAVSDKTE